MESFEGYVVACVLTGVLDCSYLYKSLPRETRKYLCRRLYSLPESEVEVYLSQICQLCARPGDEDVEELVVELCANSLNIAVKVYWILLSMSQDRPSDAHISKLRDKCELAGLEGHWQLPFKELKLPNPVSRWAIRGRRSTQGYSNSLEYSMMQDAKLLGGSLDTVFGGSPDRYPMSMMSRQCSQPDESDTRASSPDGLGSGLFSSVFMDTGVEGLLYESGHHIEGMQDVTTDRDRMDESSATAGNVGKINNEISNEHVASPPSSPRQRQTTFGATLDFVEALSSASRPLTSFAEDERQWALHKALRNINKEIDKASSSDVAIWFPMDRGAPQRVVRLAYRESRLLNSREKAPFSLFVEVLNEDTTTLEAEGILSPGSYHDRIITNDVCLPELKGINGINGLDGLKAAAEEAAAIGIPWMSQHHRKSSSADLSSFDSVALTAVKDSSAASRSLMFSLNEKPELNGHFTPSLTSQRSESSTLTAEFSTLDFNSDSSHGSPSTMKNDFDFDTRVGQLSGHPVNLPRPPVQGGGTWLGGISKVFADASSISGTANHASPSPSIHTAMNGLRVEMPLVSLKIDILPREEATKQTAERSKQFVHAKTSEGRNVCTKSTFACRLGICRCDIVKNTSTNNNQLGMDSKVVKVTLKVNGGLGTRYINIRALGSTRLLLYMTQLIFVMQI